MRDELKMLEPHVNAKGGSDAFLDVNERETRREKENRAGHVKLKGGNKKTCDEKKKGMFQ